jgi:hypothetical protein
VQRLLDGNQMAWGVFAGAAAHLYGTRRPIQDVDLLVAPGQLATVVQLLQSSGKAVQFDGQRIIWRGIKVFDDLTIRRAGATYPLSLDPPMRDRLRTIPLLGAQVAVLAPEDVVLHKLLMGRGAEQAKHDVADVEGILRRQTLDPAYLAERMALLRADDVLRPKLLELGVAL